MLIRIGELCNTKVFNTDRCRTLSLVSSVMQAASHL